MARLVTSIALLGCAISLALPAGARASKSSKTAVSLFRKALAASDLTASGESGFRLQATAHVSMVSGQNLNGVLVELRGPRGQWRKEAFFPSYSAIFGFDGRSEWVKQPLDYVPSSIQSLWQALQFYRRLDWAVRVATAGPKAEFQPRPGAWSPESLQLGAPYEEQNGSLECVNAESKTGESRTFCFAASTGLLIREHDPTSGNTLEYSDYASFGDRTYPKTLHLVGPRGAELLAIHVNSLGPLSPNVSPSPFLPVDGAERITASTPCAKALPGKLLKRVMPKYPPSALRNPAIQGRVVLHVVIGTDGVPHDLKALVFSSPVFVAAALTAVRQWRYRPTVCEEAGGSRFVPVDTAITVYFRLGR